VKFGGVRMLRVNCQKCKGPTLVVSGIKVCCEEVIREGDVDIIGIHSESGGNPGPRKGNNGPGKNKERLAILEEQGWACRYCGIPFFSELLNLRTNRVIILKHCWDHFIPYVYSRTNQTEYVAACQVCNQIKYSHMFETIEKVQDYLRGIWLKRYRVLKVSDNGIVSPVAFHLPR